jgi:hypothetical protein
MPLHCSKIGKKAHLSKGLGSLAIAIKLHSFFQANQPISTAFHHFEQLPNQSGQPH